MKEYMKENIKNNKSRLLVWGIIAFISVIFAISGIISFNKGHGTVGSVRIKLIPVANEFNKIDAVIRKGNIKAECDGKQLIITYKDKAFNIDEKYIYEFGSEEDVNYITNTYSKANSEMGDFIAINLIEAIYKLNHGTEKVSERYRISSFGATSVKDGAKYEETEELITVKLNLNTDIIKNVAELNIETIQESDYLHVDDLKDMVEKLESTRTYTLTKRDTVVYVKKDSSYYEIYFYYKDKEIMMRSAGSIIKILKPNLYDKIANSDGIVNFSGISNEYRITENVTFTEPGIFPKNERIYEIVLYN